jgi:type VI secretion system secreted protein Hcp
VLSCRKAGGKAEEFYKITLNDVLVSSFQQGGSTGGEPVPTEQMSLNFQKIRMDYSLQNAKGTTGGTFSAAYDLRGDYGDAGSPPPGEG